MKNKDVSPEEMKRIYENIQKRNQELSEENNPPLNLDALNELLKKGLEFDPNNNENKP